MPPSVRNSAPVTKPLSGPTSQATRAATSSGVPTRPAGCWAWSSGRSASPLVSIQPGLTQLARTSGPRLIGQRMGQRQQPALGGAVALGIRLRLVGAGGGDGDDGAAGGAQHRLRRADQQEGAGQVGAEHRVPLRQRQRAERLADHEAGVADQGVEPAFLRRRCPGPGGRPRPRPRHRRGRCGPGGVGRSPGSRSATTTCQPSRGEARGHGAADAPGAAGDQGHGVRAWASAACPSRLPPRQRGGRGGFPRGRSGVAWRRTPRGKRR